MFLKCFWKVSCCMGLKITPFVLLRARARNSTPRRRRGVSVSRTTESAVGAQQPAEPNSPWTTPLYRERMSFVEQPSLGREIAVPARLPMILKQFCKAAIRTQPYDLLKWSGSYFRALADGEEPPVKSRLEYPPPSTTASGLTLGLLRVLLRQFGNYNKTLSVETISRRWDCLCLDRRDLDTILVIGRFRRNCQVKRFFAIAVGLLCANLTETMIMVCQLFSHEPDGGSAMIPLTLFTEIYEYLAGLACDGNEKDILDQDTERTARRESLADRTCSINSQDTDVDINSELISKDEVDLSKTDLSEPIENSSVEKEVTNYGEKGDESSIDPKDDASAGKDYADNDAIGRKFCGVKDANDDGSLSSEMEKGTKFYPNVPGIGPRVPAERVASVTTWMLECARLQEGMVGPRNIRHTSCPRLHERSTSKS
ncbi:PREDICTED: ropporin-1-like protein [Vollenhovia emeryi]|uniref:ropporin-1-like protein n=1 Tax=Vollenhovia emeryi TaxID=411798 RepID=UPI0005F551B2|nr:PREDICTED: ropporin-1-like protein [Vollenhovia emeryi]